MFNYNDLVGLPYLDGRQDCYSLMRHYYQGAWGVTLPNLARPSRFWEDPSLDLYGMYQRFGFQQVFDAKVEIGDALLMPIMTRMNSHAAAVVDDNLILHHLPGKLSSLDPLRPKWSSRALVHLRHPAVTKARDQLPTKIHLHEVLDAEILRNPKVQNEIGRLLGSNG